MSSIVERSRALVTRLHERNIPLWNELDRDIVFTIQALNAEVQRLQALAQPPRVEPNDSFERDAAAAAKVREFMRNH